MSTTEILNEINRLPPNEMLLVIQKALKNLMRYNYEQQMTIAAEAMENEYRSDPDLTAFSNLDMEDFYETK